MNIELGFDEWTLAHRITYVCPNAQSVEKFLQGFIRTRFSRGYRLRVIPDYNTNTIEIQSPCVEKFNMALRALREHYGKSLKKLTWENKWNLMANESGQAWK